MTTDELREKFEAWYWDKYKEKHSPLSMEDIFIFSDGEYVINAVQMTFEGYQAAHESLQGEIDALRKDFVETCKALDDLSFSCFGGIGVSAPSVDVYNTTFKVLERMRPKRKAIDQAIAKGK